jgi:hypothetical protein
MSSITDNRVTRFFGRSGRETRGGLARKLRIALAGIFAIVIVYLGYLYYNFSIFHGRDIFYPQPVLALFAEPSGDRPTQGDLPAGNTENCQRSRTIAMQIRLIEMIVRENAWVPARPLYKVGFFGLVDFADTPFFDNKASEQTGILDINRRLAIELTDSLGRIRGSSAQNDDLTAAQAALRIDENAWFLNNPFNSSINTVSPSAAASYEKAIPLYEKYNADLAICAATFDTRSDNLRETLSRFTATLGSTTTQLSARSFATVYDPHQDQFVRTDGGSDIGWLDFRADNLFMEARGKMFALHGILQGMREDFHNVVVDRNLGEVWDKMETAVAEAAFLDPLIISNGRNDGVITPDHLSVMAETILRARTSMVEIRDILRD